MKIKQLAFIAASVILIQSCSKSDKEYSSKTVQQPEVVDVAHSSGLKTDMVAGEYGTYQVLSAVNNKTGQVAGFSLQNGGTCELATYTGEPHQQWRISYVSNGYFRLMNHGSGKFLQSYNYNGTQVLIQNNETTADSQLWKLTTVGTKRYKAINKASGLAITNTGTGMTTLKTYTGVSSQLWGYNKLDATSYRDDEVSRFFQRTKGTQAWDGNHSLKLTYGANAGKTIWLMNDEYYNQLQPDGLFKCYGTTLQFFHKNNAALLQPVNQSWDPLQTNNMFVTSNGKQYDEEIFHDFFGKVLWPTGVVEIGDKLYVSLVQVSGLTTLQLKMGIIDQDDNTSTVITIPGYSDQTAISYSVGLFKDDDYVYSYGVSGGLGPSLYVARFPVNNPLLWSFWDGTTWAAKPSSAQAARLVSGLNGNGIAVNKVNGKYLLVVQDLSFACDAGRNFYSYIATAPNAKFTNKKTIFRRTDYKNGHLPVSYTPMIHPQFDNGKNEVLVTYCVNFYGDCVPLCKNGISGESPDGYRPKAFRVPYSLIGL
ncbi:MAG: DUF4185 domain-containing protein [Sphingobacteriaceae bacterium]|nr:MAG: DUF4185 domain-containing protein [Sphingobacteriaceae bacterium]